MKLIRCFIVFVVVSLVLGIGSAFNGSTVIVDNEEQKDVSTEIVDNEEQKDVSTEIVDKKNDKVSQSTVYVENEKVMFITEDKKSDNQKQVEIASETSKKKDELNSNLNETKEIRGDEEEKQLMVQEIVEQTQKTEQENKVLKEESNVIDQVIVVEEKKEEIIDYEYENLLKQVEYSTFDECMEIGFEEAIKDPIGILGFSCPYIAYKGEIIGYRLQLDYTNPMEN